MNLEQETKSLRLFHNRIKQYLIDKYKGESLLDIGVGRGGDIHKWYHNGIKNVVGLDIEPAYIKEAIKRFKKLHVKANYKFYVIQANDSFFSTLNKRQLPLLYDVISCQFCFHYFASSMERLHEIFGHISTCLKKGGHFIGTVPNGEKIMELLGTNDMYENDIIMIKKMFPSNDPQGSGDHIKFSLQGTLYFGEHMISDEYLIFENVLKEIANNYSMEMIQWKNFKEYYETQDGIILRPYTQTASFINNTFVFKKH